MLNIKIEDKKTTIDVNGTGKELLDEALNIVGHLYKMLERMNPDAARLFLLGIPMIIKNFVEHADEYEKAIKRESDQKEEAPNENDTL